MNRYSKRFNNIMKLLSLTGILLLTNVAVYAQENQSRVDVLFDEPLKDTGTTYYITPNKPLPSKKVYPGAEMLSIDNKTLYFGMSENDTTLLMDKGDDEVIVFYLGDIQRENQLEKKVDGMIFRYKNDLLYEVAIQKTLETSVGNYYGWTYGQLKEALGDSTYVNSFDAMTGKGLLVYREKVGAKFFFFEKGLVKEWGITNKDYRFNNNWPSMYQAKSIFFQYGNTNGNIQNGGLITAEGDWYYYAQPTDVGEHLYKMSSDGIIRKELSKDSPRNINVKDGWLYYTNAQDWTNTGDGKIYRMKTDGRERSVIGQIGATYLLVDGEYIFFSSNGNGVDLVAGIYKMDMNGDHLTLLDPGPSKFLNIVDQKLFYVIDKKENKKAPDLSTDISVPVDSLSSASQYEKEPVAIIRSMDFLGGGVHDFNEGHFAFLLADEEGIYYADRDKSYKAYAIYADDEFQGQVSLISSVPVVGMNRQEGITYFQTIFNEYMVTKDLHSEELIKGKEHQVDQINVIGDKVFYQNRADDKLSLYQKHQWQDDWKLITPTLVEGDHLTYASKQVNPKSSEDLKNDENQLTYYIPLDKIHYISNKWRYYDSVDMTIGRVSALGYPEAEMVLKNAKIISAWDNDIYYVHPNFGHDGLYYMDSNTKLVTKINDLAIKDGFIYKNILVYSDKEKGYLYKSDLLGHHVDLLDEVAVQKIYVEDDTIYYSDLKNQYHQMDCLENEKPPRQ